MKNNEELESSGAIKNENKHSNKKSTAHEVIINKKVQS